MILGRYIGEFTSWIHFSLNPRILTRMSTDCDEALRRRFESHLPRYGTLWKSMAPKRSFLSAIESKSVISFQVGNGEGCPLYGCVDGTCSAPICADAAFETSSETSSGGSTAVAFDLSNLRLHDDDVDHTTRPNLDASPLVGEQSVPGTLTASEFVLEGGAIDASAEDSGTKRLTKHALSGEGHDEESFEYIHGRDHPDFRENDQSTGADDDSSSDDSSGGSTVIRFDISHLQDEHDSVQDDADFEILPPSSPTLANVGFQNLVDTPTGANPLNTRKTTAVSRLVKDDDSIEDSWVRPKVPSKHLEIVSDSDSDVQWNELVDSEESDDESEASEKTIISISDDESSAHASPITRACPQKPQAGKELSKGQFRKNRFRLTNEAFEEFNKVVFEERLSTITVTWSSKLRTTAGVTRCTKDRANPDRRFATIELSVKVIDEYHRLRHTILHEMCHAAQWVVDGKINPPHGACFKKWANHAMSKMPGEIVTTTHDFAIQYKYAWACTTDKCGAVFQRQSKSIDVDKHVCGKCKGRLTEINVPEKGVKGAAIDREPKKPKALSGYAAFVKENSAQVRSRMELDRRMCGSTETVVQPEVMKECAKLWRVHKNSSS